MIDLNKHLFLKSFFTFLFIFSILKLYDNAISRDAWQYGEWLINYQNGFVRRGIIGELIFNLAKLFNNNLELSFLIITSFISLIYYLLSYFFFKKIELNKIWYFILFSPIFYFFFIVISKVGINKFILFYIFYLSYLLFLCSKKYSINRNFLFFLIFPLMLLIHEAFIFFIPFLFLPIIFILKKNNYNYFIFQSLVTILFSLIIIFVLYLNKGSLIHTEIICNSLNDYAPMKCDWWGPIFALSHDLGINNEGRKLSFFYIHDDFKTYIGFIVYFVYCYLPLYVFYKKVKLNKLKNFVNKNIVFIFSLITLISTLPLFHFAEDWSRWLSVLFHLSIFLLVYLRIKNIYIFKNIVKKITSTFFVFIVIYPTLLHHHHFFFKGVRLESTYYKIFKKLSD